MGVQRGNAQAEPRGQRWNVVRPSEGWITELLPAPPRVNLVAIRPAPQVPIEPQPHRGSGSGSTAFVKAGGSLGVAMFFINGAMMVSRHAVPASDRSQH